MRIYFRIFKENRLIRDLMLERTEKDSRTHKVFHALEEACQHFDLPVPIWLDKNIRDFKRFSRCRFGTDSFIEAADLDYLEMNVMEEDIS